MISKKLIVELTPFLKLGEEKKYNHSGCKAGVDTKSRLYIKRVVGGRLAYCHHCNEHGFARDLTSDGRVLRKWLFGKDEKEPTTVSRVTKLTDFELHSIASPHIVSWMSKYKLNLADDMYFKESVGGDLILKTYNIHGEFAGFQCRSFNPRKPKYTTHLSGTTNGSCAWFYSSAEHFNEVFITEDFSSAYRINRDTGYTAVALLRTTMDTLSLVDLLDKAPKKIVIWLDPDEAGMNGAKKLTEKIRVFSTDVEVIHAHSPKEPKDCEISELAKVCRVFLSSRKGS